MARETIAVLGTGTMGSAFTRRLLGAGMRVHVWDLSYSAAARLADAGAEVARTPEDAVGDAGVVLTMVPTIASVEETMPRVLPAMGAGTIWLQMSTIGVDGTERAMTLAQLLRPDVAFVDAPVSGSKGPAEQARNRSASRSTICRTASGARRSTRHGRSRSSARSKTRDSIPSSGSR